MCDVNAVKSNETIYQTTTAPQHWLYCNVESRKVDEGKGRGCVGGGNYRKERILLIEN